MAINEKIVTGRKFRRLVDKDLKLWQLISYWTKASDVEFDDGKTAEDKVGNINGITSDFSINSDDISASSVLTHETHERINELTDDGKIVSINIDENGTPYIKYKDGADTVLKKLGSSSGSGTVIYLGKATSFNVSELYDDYQNLTNDNFIVETPSFSTSSSGTQIKQGDIDLHTAGSFTLKKNYDASKGILSASATLKSTLTSSQGASTGTSATATASHKVNAYLVVLPDSDDSDEKDDIDTEFPSIRYPY